MSVNILLICQVVSNPGWYVIPYIPHWDRNLHAAKIILANEFNEYMGFTNSGIEYRYIRASDLKKYGIIEKLILVRDSNVN
jgi:hypothetical protein